MRNFFQTIGPRLKGISKHLYALGAVFLLAGLVKLFSYSSQKNDVYERYFRESYHVFGMGLPKDMNFCGEKVPLNDFMVAEAMDRELNSNAFFHSQTLLLIKRSNRWLPVIADILKKNGIPEDYKYIPLIESNLSNVISPRGATGFWQFMEAPATHYGLEVNEEVDERYSVERSTEAICKFIKDGYKKYNSWTMTVACLNYGFGAVEEQVTKQKTTDYYQLLLPEETTRYVYRILALKEIMNDPKKYGFMVRKKDLYPPIATRRVVLDSAVTDLVAYAEHFKINYKTLKYFNPWLRQSYLTNPGKKKYEILLPAGKFNEEYFAQQWEYERNFSGSDSLRYFTPNDTLPLR